MTKILVCLDTLLDLVLQPGWDDNYEDFEPRREECERLQALIESEQISLYLLRSMISFVHIAAENRFNLPQANRAIAKILELGSHYPTIDPETWIERITQIEHLPESAALYDIECLIAAESEDADAIVVRDPALFQALIDLNPELFPTFSTQILSTSTFIKIFANDRSDLQQREQFIYPLTPQNMVVELPWGSTPIDFAYKIHSNIGDHCVRALVNHQEVPLSYRLQTRDVVEILTQPTARPDPDWLGFVMTRVARRGISRSLRSDQAQQGWQIIKRQLGNNVAAYRQQLEYIASISNFASINDFARGVALGEVSPLQFNTLIKMVQENWLNPPAETAIQVKERRQPWRIASCCLPLPGDEICGVIRSPKQPIRVHAIQCQSLNPLALDRLRVLCWNQNYVRVHLHLTISDEPDTFRPILNQLVENDITPDLRSLTIANGAGRATIGVDVFSRSHLEEIQTKIKEVTTVLDVGLAKPIWIAADAIKAIDK